MKVLGDSLTTALTLVSSEFAINGNNNMHIFHELLILT